MQMMFATGNGLLERGTIWLNQDVTLSAARTFAQKIQTYTTANIQAVSVTETDWVELPAGGSGEILSVRMAAKIFLRRRSDSRVFGFNLLSPAASTLNEYQEVPEVFGNQLAIWYSDMVGEVFDFEHGALVGTTI